MIVQVFFYLNGTLAATRDDGNQCPVESEPWYYAYLRPLLESGQIDDMTGIHVPGTFSGPLLSLRGRCPLPVALACSSPLAHIYFQRNGQTACINMAGGREPSLERPWYLPVVESLLRRGVADSSLRVIVPNVLFTTAASLLS